MKLRVPILLLATALLATACNRPVPAPTLSQRPSPSASPAPSPPPPEPVRCPLNGLPPPPGLDINRPALAVKIDNHPRARPQAGLEGADIVYEELVEGGLTRFMAIFHCGDAGDLGPTRSARAVDPDLLTQYAPVLFGYSGASPNNLRKVASTPGIIDLQHGANPAAYSRRAGRPAPNNLFTSTPKLRSLPRAAGVVGPPKTGLMFDQALASAAPAPPAASAPPGAPAVPGPAPAAPPGAPPAPAPAAPPGSKVSFAYSPASSVSYQYDPAGRRYLRFQAGAPHRAASGMQLSAVNVIVIKVPVDRTRSSPEIAVAGTGEATVLRSGQAVQGRWVRPSLADQMTLVDAAGQPIKLAPGNTWINLLPNDRPLTLQ